MSLFNIIGGKWFEACRNKKVSEILRTTIRKHWGIRNCMLKFWRKMEYRQVLTNNVAKIGEMRMTSRDKRDPTEFILLLIFKSLFAGDRGSFEDLSTDNFVLIFTVLKMVGQFSRAALEQGIRRANASKANDLTVWYVLAYRKFLSNRIGASKRDIWTRVGNVIAPSLKY